MAFFQMEIKPESLNQETTVNLIIPQDKGQEKFKTLWLLHGRGGNHTVWQRYTSIERYARELGIAVVMPSVDVSWYADTAYGKKYFTYITEELPSIIAHYFKGYSAAREDNFIMGLSMGGYGAVKAAMTYPEKYHYCASFSGALDITRKNRTCNLDEWRSIFDFEMKSPDELAGSGHDVFALAESGKDFPYFYLWCGTEDVLIDINRAFSSHLSGLKIPHEFHESEGNHSWQWWDLHVKRALDHWKANFQNQK